MAELKTTPEFKEAFIKLLGDLPNITAVSRLLGITVNNVMEARKKDPEFDQAVKDAISEGYDMIEEEARRRAVDGVLEPVFYRGEQIGDVRRYSDTLLIFLLRGCKPKKYNPGVQVKFGENNEKVSMTFNLGGD